MSRFDAGAAVLPDRTAPNADPSRLTEAASDGAEPARRDLVVVNPERTPREGKPSRYADALFIAHIFASKFGAPQQREKRRADPADANASYRNSAKRPAAGPGRVLSKKV